MVACQYRTNVLRAIQKDTNNSLKVFSFTAQGRVALDINQTRAQHLVENELNCNALNLS